MEIEFENSIRRFEFFVPSNGHQYCLDKSMLRIEIFHKYGIYVEI